MPPIRASSRAIRRESNRCQRVSTVIRIRAPFSVSTCHLSTCRLLSARKSVIRQPAQRGVFCEFCLSDQLPQSRQVLLSGIFGLTGHFRQVFYFNSPAGRNSTLSCHRVLATDCCSTPRSLCVR